MDIEEIRVKKQKLKSDIVKLLADFEKEVGLAISDINFTQERMCSNSGDISRTWFKFDVRVEV